jgi:hypothetical protein
MIETLQMDSPKTIGFKLSGKLHDEDYKSFVPTVETFLAAEGKVRLFVQFEDFHGWDLHAVWDDTKFAFKHYSDFDRIAMVGDRRWEKWMVQVCKPFTKATVRYFDASQVDDARAWLQEGVESLPSA